MIQCGVLYGKINLLVWEKNENIIILYPWLMTYHLIISQRVHLLVKLSEILLGQV